MISVLKTKFLNTISTYTSKVKKIAKCVQTQRQFFHTHTQSLLGVFGDIYFIIVRSTIVSLPCFLVCTEQKHVVSCKGASSSFTLSFACQEMNKKWKGK